MMAMTMAGLPMSTNAENSSAGTIWSAAEVSSNRVPSSMKKNTSRKSRRVVRRPLMASR
jgi:hypothetical protein